MSGDTVIGYDRLGLVPGIDICWGELPGYNEAAAEPMPHAWKSRRVDLAAAASAHHVTAIHIFNQKKPAASYRGVRTELARRGAPVSTRTRLAHAQQVIAIARLNDGSFWCDSADLIVTLAACAEG